MVIAQPMPTDRFSIFSLIFKCWNQYRARLSRKGSAIVKLFQAEVSMMKRKGIIIY